MSEAAKSVAVKTPADIVAELDIEDRLETAGAALQREKEALELARSKLELLEKYTLPKTTKALKVEAERKRSDELARQSAWELEKSREEKLNKQIESCRIIAPGDGVIVYANLRIGRYAGSLSDRSKREPRFAHGRRSSASFTSAVPCR